MAAYGVPEKDIARVVGIDAKTLRKHYREELDTGHVKANTRVAEALYRKATGDGPQSVTAAIFWLKTRAGWKETQVTEMTGNTPPKITVHFLRCADEPPHREAQRQIDVSPVRVLPHDRDGHDD